MHAQHAMCWCKGGRDSRTKHKIKVQLYALIEFSSWTTNPARGAAGFVVEGDPPMVMCLACCSPVAVQMRDFASCSSDDDWLR